MSAEEPLLPTDVSDAELVRRTCARASRAHLARLGNPPPPGGPRLDFDREVQNLMRLFWIAVAGLSVINVVKVWADHRGVIDPWIRTWRAQ